MSDRDTDTDNNSSERVNDGAMSGTWDVDVPEPDSDQDHDGGEAGTGKGFLNPLRKAELTATGNIKFSAQNTVHNNVLKFPFRTRRRRAKKQENVDYSDPNVPKYPPAPDRTAEGLTFLFSEPGIGPDPLRTHWYANLKTGERCHFFDEESRKKIDALYRRAMHNLNGVPPA